MIYPNLVPDMVCNIDVHIYIEDEGLTEEGAPTQVLDTDLKCFYQGTEKKILSSDRKNIQLSGRAFFNGDIAPNVSEITGGRIVIFGKTREIYQGFKARNPDGTVNYTRLDII